MDVVVIKGAILVVIIPIVVGKGNGVVGIS